MPELKKILEQLKLPITYLKWAVGQVPDLPYIVYYADEDVGFFADDIVYYEGYAVTIELYTEKKDMELEERVKELLRENHIAYETYEDYLETEDMFLKAYEIEI
ncbi:hypothetical protein [Claveliimonas bilis]|uniref:hypothetical protein n=1 Tax=Claveliimonas bilis TaxID=3028070 RepID=UPI00292D3A0E|nr:hypothetical protein [Claveliimonas bilis]